MKTKLIFILVFGLCARLFAETNGALEPAKAFSNKFYANEQNIKTLLGTNSDNPVARREVTSFLKSIESAVARRNSELIRPISFYGKAVDEQGEPITDVTVSFAWSDLSPSGTSKSQTTSDANGLFSITGITGHMLFVDLSKTGYYLHRKGAQFNFEFARDYDQFHYEPDPNNPVVFRFRKKGSGAELITSQYGVFPEMEFSTPRDGTPVRVDFFNRKVGDSGQLELTAVKPPRNNPPATPEWSFTLSIPDGGFIKHDDEFPYEAPETGYQSTLTFKFKTGQTNWTELIRENYYIVFGQPRKYGRIRIETQMYWGVSLGYAINPDGSRNLEPK